MEMTKQERLERLLNAYSHHYDIERDVVIDGVSFPAMAIYYLRDENYLITKKHVLNAVENHEYVYFYLPCPKGNRLVLVQPFCFSFQVLF